MAYAIMIGINDLFTFEFCTINIPKEEKINATRAFECEIKFNENELMILE